MGGVITKIEIDFPVGVELKRIHAEIIDAVLRDICRENCPEGMTMWPASYGQKPTFIPLTREEEEARGIEFDPKTYHIEIAIREKIERKPLAKEGGDAQGRSPLPSGTQ